LAKDHGSSVKNDKQYEGLRKKGMSRSRAAAISNSEGSSSRGGKKSSSGGRSTTASKAGGTKAQKSSGRAQGRQEVELKGPLLHVCRLLPSAAARVDMGRGWEVVLGSIRNQAEDRRWF